jgi:hypothetical protein
MSSGTESANRLERSRVRMRSRKKRLGLKSIFVLFTPSLLASPGCVFGHAKMNISTAEDVRYSRPAGREAADKQSSIAERRCADP